MRIATAALAPGVLGGELWVFRLIFPPHIGLALIGDLIVLLQWTVLLLVPYALLWCLILLSSQFVCPPALRITSLVLLLVGALLLDGTTLLLAWEALQVIPTSRPGTYIFLFAPVLEFLVLIAWAVPAGVVMVAAYIVRSVIGRVGGRGPRPASTP